MDYELGMDVESLKQDVVAGKVDVDRLIGLIDKLSKKLDAANRRIEELEKQLGGSTIKLDEPFSVESEEKRQEARGKKSKRKKPKGKRKGRVSTAEKLARATREQNVYPDGIDPDQCKLSHSRVVWRLENGQAVLVAYHIYRSGNQYGKIRGVVGRSEFSREIFVAIAYLVFIMGLSFDKVCALMNFFQNLKLSKSQADALMNQLSREWESEFETLCTLLANSAVVHADETSWSINSVWVFLSEHARVMFFGVNKNSETLQKILDPETFAGIVNSDDAAVYANFTNSQKCWAHLLRKAIKLTLLELDNQKYRQLTDRLLEIYQEACRVKRDRRFGMEGRKRKVAELDDAILDLCGPVWFAELPPLEGSANDYRLLANEVFRLMLQQQLFTFVTADDVEQPNGKTIKVSGTNNEAERTLRNPTGARDTGRTSKTKRGTRRRTITQSVLESLRVYLPEFTLSSVITEINRWQDCGMSCFTQLLIQLNLPPPEGSVLDSVFSADVPA